MLLNKYHLSIAQFLSLQFAKPTGTREIKKKIAQKNIVYCELVLAKQDHSNQLYRWVVLEVSVTEMLFSHQFILRSVKTYKIQLKVETICYKEPKLVLGKICRNTKIEVMNLGYRIVSRI
jgi:hypothetical protein